MSHDLERAFGDLADAAARAAERGIVGEPSVGPMLTRIVTAVRRRRTAKAVGAGALALALVGVTAGAVDLGLTHRTTTPPIGVTTAPTPLPSGPDPATTTAGPSPMCGASDEALVRLADPGSNPAPVTFAAATPATVTASDAFSLDLVVTNVSAQTLSGQYPTALVVRDHTVIATVRLASSLRGPAQAGEAAEYRATEAAQLCDGGDVVPAGDYTVWVGMPVRPLGADDDVEAIGGPWPLRIADESQAAGADPADEMFACGQPLPFDEATVPMPAGLWLAGDVPTQWASGDSVPAWDATLTTSDQRVVDVTVATPVQLVLVGPDGLVAGRTWTDAVAMQQMTVASGAPVTLPGNTTVGGCRSDGTLGGMTGAVALPAGTYTVWAFAEVTITHVDPDDGVPYEPNDVVVAVPPAATVTVSG